MNHPYLHPDEAPWSEEYRELLAIRRLRRGYDEPDTQPDIAPDGVEADSKND